MAIAGMSVVGRDKYGVFPLRGKLLNVKDVQLKKLTESEEISHIKTIMGLESGRKYTSSDDLRYGRIMIMTDQDVDGSHIKGLIFNLFESLWPSLLRVPGFLTSMLTPIVKVSKGKLAPQAFYSIQDYDAWKHSNAQAKTFSVKYYKGLGTSTAAEAKEYFREMRLVTYACDDPGCKESLDIAFSKKRADDRKEWLGFYRKDDVIEYGAETRVPFSAFINRDMIHFSIYDNQRSIPSAIDGLKPSQRKILFTCFTRSFAKDVKVRVSPFYNALMHPTDPQWCATGIHADSKRCRDIGIPPR
jgi:DNA topoisomerase-2